MGVSWCFGTILTSESECIGISSFEHPIQTHLSFWFELDSECHQQLISLSYQNGWRNTPWRLNCCLIRTKPFPSFEDNSGFQRGLSRTVRWCWWWCFARWCGIWICQNSQFHSTNWLVYQSCKAMMPANLNILETS